MGEIDGGEHTEFLEILEWTASKNESMVNKECYSVEILYAGFCRVGKHWQYKNIVSPFTRLYIFTGGHGSIFMNKCRYDLAEGDLFIVPKFTSHTYHCDDYSEHYYICFFDEIFSDHQGLFESEAINHKLRATPLDMELMCRLVELNQSKKLPGFDPKKYDNRKENLSFGASGVKEDLGRKLESAGILMQLLSRFVGVCESAVSMAQMSSKQRLSSVLYYIDSNLEQRLSVELLAQRMHMSSDNFTRVFKKVLGITPSQYIQRARVNRAQTLLLTTRFSAKEVGHAVGIPNSSQFSTLFRKITNFSPSRYVKLHLNIANQIGRDAK